MRAEGEAVRTRRSWRNQNALFRAISRDLQAQSGAAPVVKIAGRLPSKADVGAARWGKKPTTVEPHR
jgi:hypothetical protein